MTAARSVWRRLRSWRRQRERPGFELRPLTLGVYLRVHRARRSDEMAAYQRQCQVWMAEHLGEDPPPPLTQLERIALGRRADVRVIDEAVVEADDLQRRIAGHDVLSDVADAIVATLDAVATVAWTEAEGAVLAVEDGVGNPREVGDARGSDLVETLETAVAAREPSEAAALLSMPIADAFAWLAGNAVVEDVRQRMVKNAH